MYPPARALYDPAGNDVSPKVSSPHPAPGVWLCSAKLKLPPAAIAATPVRLAHIRLTDVVQPPGDHGSVALQCHAVIAAGGDGDHVCEARRHSRLPVKVDRKSVV